MVDEAKIKELEGVMAQKIKQANESNKKMQ
jgi:hypothetical protein